MQCKSLNVWSVTFSLTHFLAKIIFSRGYGGGGVYKIVVEIPEGWGGVILVVKNWKFRGGGGAYVKFPPWWGHGHFLELHNNNNHNNNNNKAAAVPAMMLIYTLMILPINNDNNNNNNNN